MQQFARLVRPEPFAVGAGLVVELGPCDTTRNERGRRIEVALFVQEAIDSALGQLCPLTRVVADIQQIASQSKDGDEFSTCWTFRFRCKPLRVSLTG